MRYAVWAIEENVMKNVQRNLLRRIQVCMMMVILNIFYKIFSFFSGRLSNPLFLERSKQSVLFTIESNSPFLRRLYVFIWNISRKAKWKEKRMREKNERNVREILTLQKTSNMQHYFIIDPSSFAIRIVLNFRASINHTFALNSDTTSAWRIFPGCSNLIYQPVKLMH